jgi:hypothetical protein
MLLAMHVSCEAEEDEFADFEPTEAVPQRDASPAIQVTDVTDPHLADNVVVRFCTS